MNNTISQRTTTTACICRRCGKNGIGSNGLCTRCDEVLFGKKGEQE